MSTGDARLDFQHKTLIDKFNELSLVLDGNNPSQTYQTAGDILDFLEFYTAWHFRQEELLMEKVACPVQDLNKMEHVDFLERLSAFHIHWLKSAIDRSMAQEVEARLAEWIATHIQLVDSKLRESLGTQAE
jgi:hemerythrin